MVSINYATREVSCKIVFYGPGLSGKTTNLQYVHLKVPSNTKGKLISLATDADRTLYFDFLPINIGTINGFASKFQLYTVPGQVYYNATRKLVLRGVDGLVFVADSQPDKMDENIESLNNLKENLAEYGYKIEELPIVIQYNKQDLPNVLSPDEMRPVLNPHGWPEFKASATEGFGVFDTLKCILKLVLDKAKTGGSTPSATPSAPASASTPSAGASGPISRPVEVPVPPQTHQPEPAPAAPAYQKQTVPAYEAPASAPEMQPNPMAASMHSAPAPETEETPPAYQRESVSEAPEMPAGPAYRPFPGNSFEDEEKMRFQHQQRAASLGLTSPGRGDSEYTAPKVDQEVDTHISKPTGTPQMAPSLKADRPVKKRSFFKRLFGLK